MRKLSLPILLAALLSCAAVAQQRGKLPLIGILWHAGNAEEEEPFRSPLREGFTALGYAEDSTVRFAECYPNEEPDRFHECAAELIGQRVDVLIAVSVPAAKAAQRATSTLPVVFLPPADPVGMGLVASLGRPGANLTGLSSMTSELLGKRVQILKEALPGLSRLALLVYPVAPFAPRREAASIEPVAASLGIQTEIVEARSAEELDAAFAAMADRFDAVMVTQAAFYFAEKRRIASLALQYRLPIMVPADLFVVDGGLMYYGPSWPPIFRRVSWYVDRILKGANPGDLPVQQPTEFELVLNLKTAAKLGISISPSLLARADRVIE
jgi:putative tryptophan/tyrosine transport system substrate-binding protein